MPNYRITKFDPQFRDATGTYNRNDWTSFSDIGEHFHDGLLTVPRYLAIEHAYIHAAVSFLAEARIDSLTIKSIENAKCYECSALKLIESRSCSLSEIADISQLALREFIWCRFEGESAYLHFGRDYYMYIGLPIDCPLSIATATESGLFIEPFDSPYLQVV